MTCEACKSFFRRSIRASAKYYCNNHNACIIDKRNRNRCQACRLRKCLDVGMQPDSVQEERAPINRDIYPRMPPYTIPFPPVQMPNNNYHYFMYPSVQQPVSVTTDPLTFVTSQEVVKVEQPSVTPCKTEPPPPYTISSGQRGSNGINGDAMPVRVPVPVQSPQTISYRTFSPPTTIHQQQQQQQLSQQQPSQQQPSQQQQQQAMLPSNTQHRRSAPTISNGVSYANTHSLQQTISAPPRKSVDPHRPHSHSTPIGPSEVDPIPPLSPTSALSDTSSVNSFPSQNVFQPPTTMGPPRQIPHTMAIQLPSCPISSDYPKPHSTPYSPFHQIQHDLSTTQEFTTMSPNPEHNSIMPYREYSPVHAGPLNSPTYPPLTMSNSQIQHDAYHPTVVRRQNSRSSSPTNSLISVGSGPSMGRPGSIISGRLYSVGGGDRNGSVISGDTSHHLRSNHDVESQGNYSFNHYRSRSPSSPTSSYSGSRPGSTRTASSYSGHSRALSHHSDPSRSRTSSISGPLTASIRSAQISGPPNSQHIYITLEQLMQSDKILDVMQCGPGTTGSMPLGDLVEACNLSLKKIVDWAKQIQMIAFISNDVLMKLMKNAWGELLCFILAIRYSREPIVQPGSGLNQQGSAYVLQQLVGDLKSWIVERQLTVVELACLKAVILFNPDCGLVGLDRQLVEVLQVQILNILKKHCRSIVPVDPTRYGQIMLKFGIIKQIGLEATSEIEVMQVLGAEIHDVLDDLMNRE